MEIIALQGHRKEGSGKVESKKIRRNGQVPAVMYKSGGGEAIHFNLNAPDVRPLVFTPKFKMAEITLNGQVHKGIVKDIQFHPSGTRSRREIQGLCTGSFRWIVQRRERRRQVYRTNAECQHNDYSGESG